MPEYTFATPEPVLLYVENGSGHVAVAARDTDQAEVRLSGRRADEVTVHFDDGRLSVLAPKQRGFFAGDGKIGMDIVVPTESGVAVRSGSADVVLTGTVGETEVKSGSGDVSVDRLGGAAVVDTGSGDVTVTEALADLKVRSGSGDVRLDAAHGSTSISTGSGDVRIGRSHSPVVVKTGSGDLEVVEAETDVAMATGSGDTTIRTIRSGRISSKGASGDVHVGIPDGTPVWTDISSVSGRVTSQVRGVGEPEEGAPYVEVRATTVSGDVVLTNV